MLKRPDVKEKAFTTEVEVGVSSPEQLTAAMKSERARFAKVIKDACIRGE